MSFEIVNDMRLLRKFKRMNLVTFHNQTGTKITGLYSSKKFTCTYIDSAKTFEHEGYCYQEKYFDGCFCPYLVRTKIY